MQAALNEQQEHNDALMSRIQRLEQTVADERTQQTALTQIAGRGGAAGASCRRSGTALAEERHRVEHLSQQLSDAAHHAARIVEQAHLEAEREAANQLVQQITNLEHVEDRVRELSGTPSTVRDECETHRGERVQLEKVAAMVPVLKKRENRHALR